MGTCQNQTNPNLMATKKDSNAWTSLLQINTLHLVVDNFPIQFTVRAFNFIGRPIESRSSSASDWSHFVIADGHTQPGICRCYILATSTAMIISNWHNGHASVQAQVIFMIWSCDLPNILNQYRNHRWLDFANSYSAHMSPRPSTSKIPNGLVCRDVTNFSLRRNASQGQDISFSVFARY